MTLPDALTRPRQTLNALIIEAYSDFPALLRVVEVEKGDPRGPIELLVAFGLTGWKALSVRVGDGQEGYNVVTDAGPQDGGFVTVVENSLGEKRAVLFLYRDSKADDFGLTTDGGNISDFTNQGFLLHELGHVNDFAMGLNLVYDDRPVNLEEAEFYANEYACRQMINCPRHSNGDDFSPAAVRPDPEKRRSVRLARTADYLAGRLNQ